MKPVWLLAPDATHSKLVPQEAGLALLRSLTGPVALVAIVGNQRGGKSTLLNLLHSRQTVGFGLGHTYSAMTTGLWIAVRKHPRADMNIVLMDTEGLDTPGVSQAYNWFVASTALLLSTVFIYQTRTSLDHSQLESFQIILQAATQLKKDSVAGANASLVWLIRDAQLATAAPRDELLGKFTAADRERIDKCFTSVDCVPLPRPVASEKDLKNVEGMAFDALTADFREEYVVLERRLFEMVAQPRAQLTGQPVTGETLAALCVAYAAAIGDGALRDLAALPTQKQLVMRLAGERAVRAGETAYTSAVAPVRAALPMDNAALFGAHERGVAAATEAFRMATAVPEGELPADLRPFLDELLHARLLTTRDTLDANGALVRVVSAGHFHELLRANDAKSLEACRVAIGDCAEAKTVADLRAQYRAHSQAVGPHSERVLAEAIEAKRFAALQDKMQENRSAVEAQIASATDQLRAAADARHTEVVRQLAEQRDSLVDGIAGVESNVEQAVISIKASAALQQQALEQMIAAKQAEVVQSIELVRAALVASLEAQHKATDALVAHTDRELRAWATSAITEAESRQRDALTTEQRTMVALVALKEQEQHQAMDAARVAHEAALAHEHDVMVALLGMREQEQHAYVEERITALRDEVERVTAQCAHDVAASASGTAAQLQQHSEATQRQLEGMRADQTQLLANVEAIATRVTDARVSESTNSFSARLEQLKASLAEDQRAAARHTEESVGAALELVRRDAQSDAAKLKSATAAASAKLADDVRQLVDDSSARLRAEVSVSLRNDAEARTKTQTAQHDSVTQSVEAMWAFLGGVNQRLTNIEASLDERSNRTATTPNRPAPPRK